MLKFSGNILSADDMRYFKQAAYFAMNYMVSPYKQRNAKVNIKLAPTMHEGGFCEYAGVNDEGKKVFNIEVNMDSYNRSGKKFKTRLRFPVRSLFHELVHVNQYLNNKMFDYVNGDVRYEGRVYTSARDTPDFLTDTSYWGSPWEWEAYGGAVCLWELFLLKQKGVGIV